jgi:hypothetical protein
MNIIQKKNDASGLLILVCEHKGQTKEFCVRDYSSGAQMQSAIAKWEASL